MFYVLKKSKQVNVKPYQRKGKYVVAYQRFDPRDKKEEPAKEEPKKTNELPWDTVERIKKKYNLNRIRGLEVKKTERTINVKIVDAGDVPEKELQRNLLIFEESLEQWKDKFDFNGRGDLSLAMGHIDEESNVKGFFTGDTLAVDSTFTSTIPHEYAHFLFSYKHNIMGLSEGNGILGRVTGDITSELVTKKFDEFLKEADYRIKQKYLADITFNKDTEKPLQELFKNLKEVYSSKSFMDKYNELNTKYHGDHAEERATQTHYIFSPTEIFARAFEFYCSGKSLAFLGELEPKNEEYVKVINEWGDKYVKTRIVKSFVILKKGRSVS